nr:hypothetical protein [Donax trunculus]
MESTIYASFFVYIILSLSCLALARSLVSGIVVAQAGDTLHTSVVLILVKYMEHVAAKVGGAISRVVVLVSVLTSTKPWKAFIVFLGVCFFSAVLYLETVGGIPKNSVNILPPMFMLTCCYWWSDIYLTAVHTVKPGMDEMCRATHVGRFTGLLFKGLMALAAKVEKLFGGSMCPATSALAMMTCELLYALAESVRKVMCAWMVMWVLCFPELSFAFGVFCVERFCEDVCTAHNMIIESGKKVYYQQARHKKFRGNNGWMNRCEFWVLVSWLVLSKLDSDYRGWVHMERPGSWYLLRRLYFLWLIPIVLLHMVGVFAVGALEKMSLRWWYVNELMSKLRKLEGVGWGELSAEYRSKMVKINKRREYCYLEHATVLGKIVIGCSVGTLYPAELNKSLSMTLSLMSMGFSSVSILAGVVISLVDADSNLGASGPVLEPTGASHMKQAPDSSELMVLQSHAANAKSVLQVHTKLASSSCYPRSPLFIGGNTYSATLADTPMAVVCKNIGLESLNQYVSPPAVLKQGGYFVPAGGLKEMVYIGSSWKSCVEELNSQAAAELSLSFPPCNTLSYWVGGDIPQVYFFKYYNDLGFKVNYGGMELWGKWSVPSPKDCRLPSCVDLSGAEQTFYNSCKGGQFMQLFQTNVSPSFMAEFWGVKLSFDQWSHVVSGSLEWGMEDMAYFPNSSASWQNTHELNMLTEMKKMACASETAGSPTMTCCEYAMKTWAFSNLGSNPQAAEEFLYGLMKSHEHCTVELGLDVKREALVGINDKTLALNDDCRSLEVELGESLEKLKGALLKNTQVKAQENFFELVGGSFQAMSQDYLLECEKLESAESAELSGLSGELKRQELSYQESVCKRAEAEANAFSMGEEEKLLESKIEAMKLENTLMEKKAEAVSDTCNELFAELAKLSRSVAEDKAEIVYYQAQIDLLQSKAGEWGLMVKPALGQSFPNTPQIGVPTESLALGQSFPNTPQVGVPTISESLVESANNWDMDLPGSSDGSQLAGVTANWDSCLLSESNSGGKEVSNISSMNRSNLVSGSLDHNGGYKSDLVYKLEFNDLSSTPGGKSVSFMDTGLKGSDSKGLGGNAMPSTSSPRSDGAYFMDKAPNVSKINDQSYLDRSSFEAKGAVPKVKSSLFNQPNPSLDSPSYHEHASVSGVGLSKPTGFSALPSIQEGESSAPSIQSDDPSGLKKGEYKFYTSESGNGCSTGESSVLFSVGESAEAAKGADASKLPLDADSSKKAETPSTSSPCVSCDVTLNEFNISNISEGSTEFEMMVLEEENRLAVEKVDNSEGVDKSLVAGKASGADKSVLDKSGLDKLISHSKKFQEEYSGVESFRPSGTGKFEVAGSSNDESLSYINRFKSGESLEKGKFFSEVKLPKGK